MENQELSKVDNTGEITKFDDFKSMEEMLSFAKVMIKSKLVPSTLRQPEQVVAIVTQGRELGFGAATALNNLHVIEGRVTLSVHAIAALVKGVGVAYKLTEDKVFLRADGTADKVKILEVVEEGGKKVTKPKYAYVDMRTTIEFYYVFNGTTITQPFSFHYSEAKDQELVNKSNWKKMLPTMMRARCLALGARFVAPQALMGMMETSEWADVKGGDYQVTEEGEVGEVTIIQ